MKPAHVSEGADTVEPPPQSPSAKNEYIEPAHPKKGADTIVEPPKQAETAAPEAPAPSPSATDDYIKPAHPGQPDVIKQPGHEETTAETREPQPADELAKTGGELFPAGLALVTVAGVAAALKVKRARTNRKQ